MTMQQNVYIYNSKRLNEVGNVFVATPLWDKCEAETHTPKSGKLESSGTPKNSELKFKGQNTSH